MKKYLRLSWILALGVFCFESAAQQPGVAINTDGAAPASAMLDVKSTDKGILIPRMTTAQRTAIAGLVKGLLVFDNTTNSFWFYNETSWVELNGNTSLVWQLQGNAGTDPSLNFIGTTDDQPLRFKVNNKTAGSITNITSRLTSLGYETLSLNTIGSDNTTVGYTAMKNNTTGFNNTAVGSMTLFWNDAGYNNTAMGYTALSQNRSGRENTALGANALVVNNTGNYNTGIGYFSLRNNVDGTDNTAVGNKALAMVTSSDNTAIGSNALGKATTGFFNTAIGSDALYENIGGYNNVALGQGSLFANTSGFQNNAMGRRSMYANTTGAHNTALGYFSLGGNVDGNYNIAIGGSALQTNTSGDRNTAIGYTADVSTNGLNNATAIGYNAIVNTSNSMLFGNTSVTKWGFGRNVSTGVLQVGDDNTNGNGAYLSASGTWTNVSDRNKKENFSAIDGGELLDKIMELSITRWNYKDEGAATHIGPMAQDFHQLFGVGDDDKAISSVDPSGIALRAIQELIIQNKKLREELETLRKLAGLPATIDHK